MLARRHNQSPMNGKRNVLLSLINRLGDIHDLFSENVDYGPSVDVFHPA